MGSVNVLWRRMEVARQRFIASDTIKHYNTFRRKPPQSIPKLGKNFTAIGDRSSHVVVERGKIAPRPKRDLSSF